MLVNDYIQEKNFYIDIEYMLLEFQVRDKGLEFINLKVMRVSFLSYKGKEQILEEQFIEGQEE